MIINTDVLRNAMRLVAGAVPSKSVMPVLANALFADEKVACTNLTVRVEVKLPVYLPRFAVDAKKLLGVLESFTGDDTDLDLAGTTLTVSSNGAKARLPLAIADDFPKPPADNYSDKCLGEFTPDILHTVNKKIAPFALNGDTNPVLRGVCLKSDGNAVVFYAMDGYRASRLERPLVFAPTKVVVPVSAIDLAAKATVGETVRVWADNNWIWFESDTVSVGSALLAGTFPDIDALAPRAFALTLPLAAGVLDGLLKLVEPFAGGMPRVAFALDGNTLTVSVNDPQVGRAERTLDVEPIRSDGALSEFGFSFSFLSNAAKALGPAPVDIAIPANPSTVRLSSPNDPGYAHYLALMRA